MGSWRGALGSREIPGRVRRRHAPMAGSGFPPKKSSAPSGRSGRASGRVFTWASRLRTKARSISAIGSRRAMRHGPRATGRTGRFAITRQAISRPRRTAATGRCHCVYGVDRKGLLHIVHLFGAAKRLRRTWIAKMIELAALWKPHALDLWQRSRCSRWRSRLIRTAMRKAGTYATARYRAGTRRSRSARSQSFAAWMENGLVRWNQVRGLGMSKRKTNW